MTIYGLLGGAKSKQEGWWWNVSFATASWITCLHKKSVKCWSRASPLGTALSSLSPDFSHGFVGVSKASSTNENPQSVDTWNYEITTPRVELKHTGTSQDKMLLLTLLYNSPSTSLLFKVKKKNGWQNSTAANHTIKTPLCRSWELLSPFPIRMQQH